MPSLKVCNESINVRSVISFSTIPKLCMQCVLIYMYIDTQLVKNLIPKAEMFCLPLLFTTHPTYQPLSHQSTKQNCTDRLYLQKSRGVCISKRKYFVAEAITNKLSPTEDLPTGSATVSSFSFLQSSY